MFDDIKTNNCDLWKEDILWDAGFVIGLRFFLHLTPGLQSTICVLLLPLRFMLNKSIESSPLAVFYQWKWSDTSLVSPVIVRRIQIGSCIYVLKASVVECWLIPSINTLDQHLDQPSINISMATCLTLDQQWVNSQLCVDWLDMHWSKI